MAKSRLVLAVAGAGKTYYLADKLKRNKRNIYITFTNKNVDNINREIKKLHGEVPKNTIIMTYAKFVYNWLIKPINSLLKIGDRTGEIIKGLDLRTVLEKPFVNGQYNFRYIKQDNYRHYLNRDNHLYIGRMIKLFNKQDKRIRMKAYQRLAGYCDFLFIDEVQDFRSQDYDLLIELFKLKQPRVISVGDYYQHSVSMTDQNLRKPFRKGKNDIPYAEYIKGEEKYSIVDTTSLIYSRRVSRDICKFIREKLGIKIYSKNKNFGKVIQVQTLEELKEVLEDPNIVKMVYQNSRTFSFNPVVNWSYSKGDTYKVACVILTDTFSNLFESDFSIRNISQQTVNNLYVALTRSKNNLYIVKRNLFTQISKDYQK